MIAFTSSRGEDTDHVTVGASKRQPNRHLAVANYVHLWGKKKK
jgi:hypothetical protein